MKPYYQTRVRMRDGWWIMESHSAWVLHALEPGPRGDFCRWMLRQENKQWMRAWAPWWVLKVPPLPYDMRFVPSQLETRAVAWLLTVYALWRAVR